MLVLYITALDKRRIIQAPFNNILHLKNLSGTSLHCQNPKYLSIKLSNLFLSPREEKMSQSC